MKKLLLVGAVLLGLCSLGQTVQAGPDEPDYNYQRPAPNVYEGRVVAPRCYLPPPPPPPVFVAPPPVVFGYGYPYYRHRHYYPYGYGYRYAPGIHIGIGF